MHIHENDRIHPGKTYCYVGESLWNSKTQKYDKPIHLVGQLSNDPMPIFMPNNYMSKLLRESLEENPSLTEKEILTIKTVIDNYGNSVFDRIIEAKEPVGIKTAKITSIGPSLVFSSITKEYGLDSLLIKAFGVEKANKILAISWFLTCEGDALSNSSAWLDYHESPIKDTISSQEISDLLGKMSYESQMMFFKLWLKNFTKSGEKILYDLTSISYDGECIELASWGHNKDGDKSKQINYCLLCVRSTGMPIFAWELEGSISDTKTLKTSLEFLNKLGFKPDCLMMDRAFDTAENLDYMFHHNYKFLQILKNNSNWVKNVIDYGRAYRESPDNVYDIGKNSFFISTTECRWISQNIVQKNGNIKYDLKSPFFTVYYVLWIIFKLFGYYSH
ncbi:MAG: transposase [Christensenellaceae bacterium]|nr:transposase [Christensenellaceae bacterium]